MKTMHRTKALAAYEGARLTLNNNMSYPTYMLLKEAVRGVLSYMAEDFLNIDIDEKTKLTRLVDLVNSEDINSDDNESIQALIDAEKRGLEHLLSMGIDTLRKIKKSAKHLIATYLKEPV